MFCNYTKIWNNNTNHEVEIVFYATSPLADDTHTNIDDGYGELVSLQKTTPISWLACFYDKPNHEVKIVFYKTSSLAYDTRTNIDDVYKLDMLKMKDMSHLCSSIDEKLVLTQIPKNNVLMLQLAYFNEPHKEAHETENDEALFESDIDTLINDVNNFCLFAELYIYSGIIYDTSLVEDDTSTDNIVGFKIEILDLKHPNDPNWELP